MQELDSELKSVVGDLVNKIAALFTINISKKESDKTITRFYSMGYDDVETQFNLNIKQNSKELAFLKEYTFENIKSFTEEMKEKLRKELSQGLLNSENGAQLSKRVSKVFSMSKERAQMIVRTETNRTFNTARQSAAEKSGLKLKKKWVAALDDRTSQICKSLDGKTIALTHKFDYKGQKFDNPPGHVNCRSRLVYVPF